jgi:hypothetical protein
MVVNTNDSQLAFVNDNTVEAAVVLMEKIGYTLDTTLEYIEAKNFINQRDQRMLRLPKRSARLFPALKNS